MVDMVDIKVKLLKGWVTKRDLGCVVNSKVGCKMHHAFVPCCRTLDMFDTAKSGSTCTRVGLTSTETE